MNACLPSRRFSRALLVPFLFAVSLSLVAQVDPINDSVPGSFIHRSQSLVYRLFADPAATAATPRPLVVFLHGLGERGTDNQKQVKAHIAPLIDTLMNDPEFHGYLVVPQSQNGWWKGDAVADLAQHLMQDPNLFIDPAQVYVTGLSAGGAGTYSSVALGLDTFAAAIPLSAVQRTNDAAACAERPLWLIHGDNDSVVGAGHSYTMRRLMVAEGGTPRFTIVPGWGHSAWARVYDENPDYVGFWEGGDPADDDTIGLYDWLFRQNLAASERPIELASEQSLLVDFGRFNNNNQPNNETTEADGTGRIWNNFVKFQHHAFAGRLVDQQGRTTRVSAFLEGAFTGYFSTTTSFNGDQPQSAAFDGMFAGDNSGNTAALNKTATLTLSGLQPNAAYRVALFGSAEGDDYGRGRTTRYRIGTDIRDLETGDNLDQQAVFESVNADAAGKLHIQIGVAPDGGTRYAQLNTLTLTALGDETPDEPRLEEGHELLIDFGSPTVACPSQDAQNRFWNNVTDTVSNATRPSLTDAVDTLGNETGIQVHIPDGFEGRNTSGVSAATLFPVEAQRDTLWAGSHSGHATGLNRGARVVLSGLTPGATYDLALFSSRKGADGDLDRLTRYQVDNQVIDFDVTDNTDTTVDFNNVTADAAGTLTIEVGVSPAGTGRYCYLGALSLTAVAMP